MRQPSFSHLRDHYYSYCSAAANAASLKVEGMLPLNHGTWRNRPVKAHEVSDEQVGYNLAQFSPSDVTPAETHSDPSGDQLQHKLAGVTTIIGHVIGKLDAGTPLFCHHPHFK